MKLSRRTSQFLIKLTLLSLLMPFVSSSKAVGNPAVGTPTADQANQLNQKQQDTDRSGSAGAATAMAAMGAAMAGLGCMMGLKAAQEEPDPSKKAMLQMMAMQQCGQAAQNAASAAQNADQKKKLDSQAPIQATPFQAPEIKVPEDSKETDLSKLGQGAKSSDSSNSEPKKPDPFEPPVPEQTKSASSEESKKPPIPEIKAGKSVPALLGAETITAKMENQENSGQSNDAVRALGSALSGKGSVDDLMKKALAENGTNPNDLPMVRSRGASGRKDGTDGYSGDGGGGSSNGGSSSEGSSSPFENLLAQMMGGGQAGNAIPMGFDGGADIISLAKNKNGQPKLNIFQFAGTVYADLARSQNRISTRPTKPASPVSRALSSMPNLVTKASNR